MTYTEVAYWVGPLTSARMVAGACAANPIALTIPCHRVIRSNGDLGGYRWGVERKREMIRRERWHERPFVQCFPGLCVLIREGAGCRL
ncbi:MAG: MGMT family protein [Acidobacteriaceae bacterium]|nr:MGMT family protein [Acidobacteriaceae bacterium]